MRNNELSHPSPSHGPFHQEQQHPPNMNYGPVMHGYHQQPMDPMGFNGRRFMPDVMEMRPRHMTNQAYLPRPTFHQQRPAFRPRPPMMPIVQPHLNRHFIPQHHPQQLPFTPIISDMSPIHPISMEDDMPMLPDIQSTFEPTPPSRLSPRSAQ